MPVTVKALWEPELKWVSVSILSMAPYLRVSTWASLVVAAAIRRRIMFTPFLTSFENDNAQDLVRVSSCGS